MRSWAAKQDLVTLREAPQRDVWLMHPAIVNAWYSPNHNTISKYSAVRYCTVQYILLILSSQPSLPVSSSPRSSREATLATSTSAPSAW